ncbi:MAG: FtsX-like permease family protein [Saprospiraceae bacterium]
MALFILLIACINFMNLTTARSAHRAKEIGVRKVMGSIRSALVGQFLSETILMAAIGVLLAVNIAALAMFWFNDLTGRDISMPGKPHFLGLAHSLTSKVGGAVGQSHPAFFLSAFDTISAAKGSLTGQAKHGGQRLWSFSSLRQLSFCHSYSLGLQPVGLYPKQEIGFRKDQVILEDAYALGNDVQAFKQKNAGPPVHRVGHGFRLFADPSSRSNTTYTSSRDFRQDNTVNMGVWAVDEQYLKTLGMEMIAGRFFDENRPSDSLAIVLNESSRKEVWL